jgi:hypothetical protein
LPRHFVAHVLAQRAGRPECVPPEPRFGLYDPRPWLAWGRAEGACLDLAGWLVPDAASRRRIRAELGRAPGTVVLCRTSTREVVLAQRDGTLTVHTLRPGGPGPRRLAGWHRWPAAR